MLGSPTLLVELATAGIFLLTGYHAARRGRRALVELVSAALYGLLLEEGDILIFGSYFYSSDFILVIHQVPITIALAWAVIIYSCLHISDAYRLSPRLAPFADAIWAIALDFAFDAVAIRIGFWQWNIPLDAGYFGVPAGNFYAWLLVAFSFSAVTRWQRAHGSIRWQLAVPLVAYVGLFIGFVPYVLLKVAFFPAQGGGLPIFVALALAFTSVLVYAMWRHGWPRVQRPDLWPLLARLTFHTYFLGAIFVYGLERETPMLLVVALAMLAFEGLVAIPLLWPRPPLAKADAALGRQENRRAGRHAAPVLGQHFVRQRERKGLDIGTYGDSGAMLDRPH